VLAGLWLSPPVPVDAAGFDPAKIAGTWQARESHPGQGDIETVFIIRDDGTFSGSMAINGEVAWTYGGDWTLEGSRITWHYTRSSLTLHEAHRTESDEILSLDADTLTYRSGSRGTISSLQRLPDIQP
jgi:hypothetical protein